MRLHYSVVFLQAFFLLVIGLAVFVCWSLVRPGPAQQSLPITIPEGSGAFEIAAVLQREQLIHHRRWFLLAVYARGTSRSIYAGEYDIPPMLSAWKLAGFLKGAVARQHRITIVEGEVSYRIVKKLNDSSLLSGAPLALIDEGSLLPETYFFNRGTDRRALVTRMHKAQIRFITRAWVDRAPNLPLNTPQEAIILASIVEKEALLPEERPIIAGVLINRLRRGMKLQSDPTVGYGLSRGAPMGRALDQADFRKKTPYNTYLIKALPITPIAHPGKASIRAVLNPADTRALYYVADGQGGHRFAEDYAAHRRNVRLYQAANDGKQESDGTKEH